MNSKRKRGGLLQSYFAEDLPGQFLRAQLSRYPHESYSTSSDQDQQPVVPPKAFVHSNIHRRSLSVQNEFDVKALQMQHNSRDRESRDVSFIRDNPREKPRRSASYWCPDVLGESLDHMSEISETERIIKELSGRCVIEESPSKEESQCLSEDDLTIIDLHTNMSKILQQQQQEKESIERYKRQVKQQLLGFIVAQSKEIEDLVTPRSHWTLRTSSASNATQVAAGSLFMLDALDSATQSGNLKSQPPREDESCLVKIESEDPDSPEKPKRILKVAFKTVFNEVPRSQVTKALKSIDTLVHSTLVALIDNNHDFQGLYRLNQTYSLLHKLAGADSAPDSIACSSIGACYTFDPSSLTFVETASRRVSTGTHAISIA